MTAALIILTAGFYAQNSEETYPSGPSYDIGISDAHGQSLSTLIDLATSHHVTLAKVTYEPDGHGGNSRIISIFGSLGNKNGIHADSPYPDYGFGLRTQVQRGDEFTDPLGRWLLYGSPQETASVAQSMLDCGFELNKSNSVSVARITCQFFLNSIAQIVFVGLAVMFASGALSASVASRVCAIQALHGVGTAGIIIRQFLQHALFFTICACTGWTIWTVVGAIFWSFASSFGFAGQVFLSIIIITTCMALIALVLAIILVRTLVPSTLKLIQGKRPLRFLMASGCVMAVIVLSISSASLNVANFKWHQAKATKTTLEHQLSTSNAFQLQLWYTSDQNRTQYMPSWNTFMEHATQSGHARFASLQLACTWVDRSDGYPSSCIFMDFHTAQFQHLVQGSAATSRISVIMPADGQWDSELITDNVLRAYSFEQSIATKKGKDLPAINRTDISVATRLNGNDPSAFNASSDDDDLSLIPVIVIDPSLFSGDTTTSMVSTGGMVFNYDSRHQLLEILQKDNVAPLVASVVSQHDEIRTRLARTVQEMSFFFAIACVSVTCLLGGAIMVSLTLCALRRQIMFVEYMHGAPSYLRFGPILFLTATLCSVSIPVQLLLGGYSTGPVAVVSALFATVSLAATMLYDSRLRADSIKHP